MPRSAADQAYIERLKARVEWYQRRETDLLAYIRKLERWCVKNRIGIPLHDKLEEAVKGILARMRQEQEGEQTPGDHLS